MAAAPTIPPRIFAVVLAAGEARRYGRTKQLARLPGRDESLIGRAIRIAAEVCGERVLLVVGHDAAAVVAHANARGFVVLNDRFADGIGTSVACAARSLAHTADAILLILADQARISASHLAGLCSAWTGGAGHVITTAFAGAIGAPALLPHGTFARLAQLSGDRGAQVLFGDDDVTLTSLRFEDAAIDIDTPNDLASVDQSTG